ATRTRFFHNGVYDSLAQDLAFYNFCDVSPERIYPVEQGSARTFDDLLRQYHANVHVADSPIDRPPGQAPARSERHSQDIIAILKTLTDGAGATRASSSTPVSVATPPTRFQPARRPGESTPRR